MMGEVLIWLSRYWIGGLFTLLLIDGVNYLLSKYERSERFNNIERVWIFVLWPLTLTVFVVMWLISAIRRQ